jgi:hypothetical protein
MGAAQPPVQCRGLRPPRSPRRSKNGETGHCVHNMVRARTSVPGPTRSTSRTTTAPGAAAMAGAPGTISARACPRPSAFPSPSTPTTPIRVWVVPLNGDSAGRYPPGASAAVWVSNDAGETWSAQHSGLPTKNCFFTVLRQAMATDHQPEPGGLFRNQHRVCLRLHSTGVRPGTRSPATCPPFWGWRHSRPASCLAVLLHAGPLRIRIARAMGKAGGQAPRCPPDRRGVSAISAACASSRRCVALRVPGIGSTCSP